MKKVVFVIQDRFADWEPAFLSMALNGEVGEKCEVRYASTDTQPKKSIGGMTVLPDLAIREVPEDTDVVVFIGADGSWHQPQADAEALARRAIESGKIVAGICDAARWLGSIGALNGVQHTVNDLPEMADYPGYTNQQGYLAEESVRDKRIVTANGNAPVAFAANVLREMKAAPEEEIRQFEDFYSIGYHAALKKYGYT